MWEALIEQDRRMNGAPKHRPGCRICGTAHKMGPWAEEYPRRAKAQGAFITWT